MNKEKFRTNIPKQGSSLFAIRSNLDSLFFAILAFYFVRLLTRHSGIGISPDSVAYLSAARNFRQGLGLIQFDLHPLVDFPAGYPLFLALVSGISGLDPLVFSPILNGLLFGSIIYGAGSLMNGFQSYPRMYKFFALSILLMSPCLLEIYPMLWSETLFILLTMTFFFLFGKYCQQHSLAALVSAAAVCALACITRYAGVSLLATACVMILLDPGQKMKQRLKHLFLFFFLASSLLIINLIRNRQAAGFATGARQRGITPLIDNCYYFGSVFCEWLPLLREHRLISLGICFLFLFWLGFLVIRQLLARKFPFRYEDLAIYFALLYSLFILFSATVSRYQQLNSRLLAPLFLPLVWILGSRLAVWQNRLKGLGKGLVAVAAFALLVAWQYKQFAADWETWDGVRDAGLPDYTEDPFPQSQIVTYVKEKAAAFQSGYRIYSNAADAFYFFSRRNAFLLPERAFPEKLNRFYAENNFYLIWFNAVGNPDEPALEEIITRRPMVRVADFPDGSVWITAEKAAMAK